MARLDGSACPILYTHIRLPDPRPARVRSPYLSSRVDYVRPTTRDNRVTWDTMLLDKTRTVADSDVFAILSNERRRHTLEYLCDRSERNRVDLRDLAEAIATAESGESPAPRPVRHAVYVSLHQTHLPMLDTAGVLAYDADRKHVRLLDPAREVERYMTLTTVFGVSWAEYYRALGVVGLFVVVAALADLPLLSAVPPLAWASGFLVAFALSSAYQLWGQRGGLLRALL